MGALCCHGNQSSNLIIQNTYLMMLYMEFKQIGKLNLEIYFFENVDGSGELKMLKKTKHNVLNSFLTGVILACIQKHIQN